MATIDESKIHHMKVTASGQVSIPAEVRRRWSTTRVKIIDEGGRLIIEPEPDNPFADLIGILADEVTLTADEMKAEDLAAEEERDRRKWSQFTDGTASEAARP